MAWKYFVDYDLRDGSLTFEPQPDFETGMSFDVWEGNVVRFDLPLNRQYDEYKILEWFREEFSDDLQVLRVGWRVKWDGSDYVGSYLSEGSEIRALDFRASIEQRIEDAARNDYLPSKEIWDAADYWLTAFTHEGAADDMGITASTTDDELEEIVAEMRMVHSDVVFTGLEEFCESVREALQEGAD